MFFNGGLIPNYVLITSLGLKNTHLGDRPAQRHQRLQPAGDEGVLREPAGASWRRPPQSTASSTYGILWRIVLPLSKAVIATMVLFYAVSFWNSWFSAFLYMDQAGPVPGHRLPAQPHRRAPPGRLDERQRRATDAADRRQHPVGDHRAHHPADPARLPLHPALLRLRRDARRGQGLSSPFDACTIIHRERKSSCYSQNAAPAAAVAAGAARWRSPPAGVRQRRTRRATAADLSANTVGAMDEVRRRRPVQGDRAAVASRSCYSNHPTYPFKDDWLFWQELTKRTNVTLEPVVGAAAATTSRSAAC